MSAHSSGSNNINLPAGTGGTPEAHSRAHGGHGTAQRPLPHRCGRCLARWEGRLTCHCPSCHETFTAPRAFDAHRRMDSCAAPASVGLYLHSRAGYAAWGGLPMAENVRRERFGR